MSKPLPTDDFRAVRWVLEPADFAAGGDQPEPPPSDLVERPTWDALVGLPDDVAIRTSNHHGTELKLLGGLYEAWVDARGWEDFPYDPVFEVMLDACDEFESAAFFLLCGYYRQAIACLRNALELVCIGCYGQSPERTPTCRGWRSASQKLSFDVACGGLAKEPAALSVVPDLGGSIGERIFGRKSPGRAPGWARDLYDRLSDFAHSRPQFMNVDLWKSNGPVYDREAFRLVLGLFAEVYAVCYIAVKLAKPSASAPAGAMRLFEPDGPRTTVARAAYLHLSR